VEADPDIDVVFVASRHDSHATIVRSALLSQRHVFCEKPLAITNGELDGVVDALNSTSGVLMVGFNRRWSPAVHSLVDFIGRSGPIQISYRVHAGNLPDNHWLKDRRQGGRLLGEACHFIDTCNAITGEAPRSVYAIGSGEAELLLQEDFTITLDYPSGSQAVIVYSAGAPRAAGKERVDIMRGDRSAVIEDFRSLTLSSATKTDKTKYKPADKGHSAEFVAFREAIEGKRDADEIARWAFETSRVDLGAVESLMTGNAVSLDWS
jgi:predicted dehydrogenase